MSGTRHFSHAKPRVSRRPSIDGVPLKKQLGQHFLRDEGVIERMIAHVDLRKASVFEIGCGDGALTTALLRQPVERLWVFEIDPDWANYVTNLCSTDKRFSMHLTNVLDYDFRQQGFAEHAPWVLMANLPYNVTFPIIHVLRGMKDLLREGIIMVQEEVAQKITATGGRSLGWLSLYLQHSFVWHRLEMIKPGAFYPSPKVNSRLLHFVPRTDAPIIPDETLFWKMVKASFSKPRRMIRNNLSQTHYDITRLDETTLNLRAQQMTIDDFLRIWDILRR